MKQFLSLERSVFHIAVGEGAGPQPRRCRRPCRWATAAASVGVAGALSSNRAEVRGVQGERT